MKVTVHLHSSLQVQTPDGPRRKVDIDLDENAAMEDLISSLKLKIGPERLLLGINGEIAKLTDMLHDGDHVHLMLPISGG